jgi:cyclopropane fatty-acyl-phospholipid synthase-like methyltransferase
MNQHNKEHKLGLPLEYQQMPEYFDAHNISEQTEAKNALIEKLLKEQKAKTVLDMSCGTGSQVFYLAEVSVCKFILLQNYKPHLSATDLKL